MTNSLATLRRSVGERFREASLNRAVFWLGLLACLAAVALGAVSIVQPFLFLDDFQILAKSWTWQTTCAYLWIPQNEHIMPLGRLSTWGLVAAAGRPSGLPLLFALHGPAALVLAMVLVYLFVRRELVHPLYGLVAMTLFGVTGIYQQAVSWFAASFSILALDMLLLGLLAAQRFRQTGLVRYLVLSALWCTLAPGWFASGILAGPSCFVYLLPRDGDPERRSWLKHLAAAVPLAGTVLFLGLVFGFLKPVVEQIRHLEHYGDKTAEQSFDPVIGARNTARSVVDNLVPGMVGVWGLECPVAAVAVLVGYLIIVVAWWIWLAPRRRLGWLGLSLIGLNYWLVYSARAEWDYAQSMNTPAWSRYHLLPQLGLTLLICAGLARWASWFQVAADGRLSRRQIAGMALLIAGCFLTQLPRSMAGQWGSPSTAELAGDPWAQLGTAWRARQTAVDEQQAVLRRIEAVDARCRLHHIGRESALQALPWLEIPLCYQRENGWLFLDGSPQPRAKPAEEVRRLLLEDDGAAR